jgi:hypothetical protein
MSALIYTGNSATLTAYLTLDGSAATAAAALTAAVSVKAVLFDATRTAALEPLTISGADLNPTPGAVIVRLTPAQTELLLLKPLALEIVARDAFGARICWSDIGTIAVREGVIP